MLSPSLGAGCSLSKGIKSAFDFNIRSNTNVIHVKAIGSSTSIDKPGQVITYSLSRWGKLSVYTTNARIQIVNNSVKQEIRSVAMGRKAFLFAGSDDAAASRTAMIYSLFATPAGCIKSFHITG